jgi:nodulation protein E
VSSNSRRVAITGIGIVSPLGRGAAEHVAAVRDAKSGIRTIAAFDASAFTCRIAGEAPPDAIGESYRELDRFARLALVAAADAATQANLTDASLDPTRIGTIIGTALGGGATLDAGYIRLYGQQITRLHPMTVPRSMYNAATSAVSAKWRALGPAVATVSACASSAHAIGQAAHWIRHGFVDMVIAGGADAPIVPGIVRAWEALRVLAPAEGDPASACRPFSADRKGIVLAEGAAVLILETFESAGRRGMPILGEIAGMGMSSDAGHITDPSVEGAARALRFALDDAQLNPGDVEYINAHGTATRANDVMETAAIRAVFGAACDRLPVSSTKSMHGHAMGASGAIEIALSLLAVNEGVIPATLNYRQRDSKCDLDVVPNEPREATVRMFLSSSFGFGGMNGVVAVRSRKGL